MPLTQNNIQKALGFKAPGLLIQQFQQKYSTEHTFSREDTEELFEEVKKFLIVCANDRTQHYCPSKHVDEMWHEFLLFTEEYTAFCDLLGGYIHHIPSRVYPEFFSNAIREMAAMFKKIDSKWWNVHFVEGEPGVDPYCDGSSCYC